MKPQNQYMDSFLPADFYRKIRTGEFQRQLFPAFSDRAAWETIKRKKTRQPLIRELMKEAEPLRTAPPPVLLFSNYCQYGLNGNRSEYEHPYFLRRNQFGTLVLALCLSGDRKRWLFPVLDYLTAILEESSWCVPAHACWNGKTPDPVCQSDLFASETGGQLGVAVNILGDLLDEECPGLTGRIRQETLTRTVRNVLSPKTRPLNGWFDQEVPGNWTPWCSYNNLLAAACLEQDPQRLVRIFQAFLRPVSRFAWYYNQDGYCAEGPGYYNRAAGMLFKITELLEKLVSGSMKKFYADPKNRAMFEFYANAQIGGDQLSFGDAAPRRDPLLSVMLSCAGAINSPALMAFGKGKPLSIQRGCGDELNETLSALFDCPEQTAGTAGKVPPLSFFKDRLAILRTAGLSAALKAGNNQEPHNHNDLGHFTIYNGDDPVIVDAGTARYAKINFSPERYTLWYTRGSGHNAPLFGEIEQMESPAYALLPEPERTGDGFSLTCDLSNAYPSKAGVRSFLRTMKFAKNRVVIEDSFKLKKKQTVTINLLTPEKPAVRNNTIRLGKTLLTLDGIEYAGLETPLKIANSGGNLWKSHLTRIILKTDRTNYKLIFSGEKQ